MAADWGQLEAADGVRLSWNVWPNSRLEAAKCVVPLAALYTPLRPVPELPVVPYDPVRCKGCASVLNPYARVDFVGKNHFPPHYGGISESALPAELFPSYTTLEYALPRPAAAPPCYVFVLDTCVEEGELSAAKQAVLQALSLLPGTTRVGLVTFGAHVAVHELGFENCPKAFIFRGGKEHSADSVADALGLPRRPRAGAPPSTAASEATRRFLLPLEECEFALASALEELAPDGSAPPPEQRPARATGAAAAVGTALLAACCVGAPGRLVMLLGGPASEGPGAIVARELAEPVRSHKDITKDAAPFHKKAKRTYEDLATALVASGHSLDVFASALEQVGLAELRPAVERTGGVVVLAESFAHDVFKHSFSRHMAGGHLCSGGSLEVITSRDVRCEGALGPLASSEKQSLSVADTQVGVGGTCAWKLNSLSSDTTLAFYFEVPAAGAGGTGGSGGGAGSQPSVSPQQQFFIQFVTQYATPSGEWRARVTTVTRRWTDGASVAELGAGFDQEAAAALVARLVAWKQETEEEFDATRFLDRTLIRLCSRFGDYRKDDASSFGLAPGFAIYPQFMFNLRRSQFVQVFNNSPDETAYFRTLLNRAPVTSALVMIQPSLMAYSFTGPPEPVLLDVASIGADRILLLDAYFSLVIFHGAQCAAWRKAGYAEQPEHAAFAALLAAPKDDAAAILGERFPYPRVVDCDQGGSQARFLLARLNPSATHNSAQVAGPGGDVIFTDDVSLKVFMEHLAKLAVTS